MIEIFRLTEETADVEQVNKLLAEQSPGGLGDRITHEELAETLSNPRMYVLVAVETETGTYIGMASIFFQRNLARWISEIHDVVVLKEYRGKGVGKLLTNAVMEVAAQFSKSKNAKIKLYLTSRPSRVAANSMYRKLRFVKVSEATVGVEWGTNLYKIIVEPQGFRGLP